MFTAVRSAIKADTGKIINGVLSEYNIWLCIISKLCNHKKFCNMYFIIVNSY